MQIGHTTEPLWNSKAVSDYLGIDPSTFSHWKKEGYFPRGRDMGGGLTYWPISDVEAFIEKKEGETQKS